MTTLSPPLAPDAARRRTTRDAVAVAVLVAGVLFIYGRTVGYGFVNYDDPGYVYQNSHVTGGLSAGNVGWAVRSVVLGNYHPLTELVQLIIVSLFGVRPGAFHAVNAALHAANAGLVFLVLRRFTGRFWPAAVAAGLWAWHPLRVESVAWVSELKDVLCGTLTLLTLLAYARYAGGRTPRRYLAVAGAFTLALLAKPMAVTVPAVLLLLDYWPLGGTDAPMAARPIAWWRDRVLEKVPLAALGVAEIAYTFHVQRVAGSAGSLEQFGVGTRLGNAVASTLAYLGQTVWPTRLAVFYPHPALIGRSVPVAAVIVGGVVLLAITAGAGAARRRVPAVLVGWSWFLVMLVPVIGLVQVGEQARADRYTYLPSIGLTWAAVWAVAAVARSRAAAALAVTAGVTAAAAALAVSVVTVRHWRDTVSLFTHAMAVVPDNYQAMLILADDGRVNGDPVRALGLADRAVGLTGDRAVQPYVIRGVCLLATGRPADVQPALESFVHAGRVQPANSAAWSGMGQAIARQAEQYAAQGRTADVNRRVNDAVAAYRRALALNPDDVGAADRLGFLLNAHGQYDQAMDVWRATLGRWPNDPVAHGDLAAGLQRQGRTADAVDEYRTAVADGDRRPDTQVNLAWLLAINPQTTPADLAAVTPATQQACEDPDSGRAPFPWYAYSVVLARQGRFDDATAAASRALDLARSTGQTSMAAAVEKRLAAYRQGLVAGPTTRPATSAVTSPASPAPAP